MIKAQTENRLYIVTPFLQYDHYFFYFSVHSLCPCVIVRFTKQKIAQTLTRILSILYTIHYINLIDKTVKVLYNRVNKNAVQLENLDKIW